MADEAGPDDVRAAGDPTAPPPPEAPSAPPIAAEAATPAATPAPPAPTTAAPAGPQTVTIQADPLPAAPNPLVTAWNDLDATSRMIIGAAGVLLASLLIGGLFSAWFRSGTFVIAVAAAALVSAGAAAYTSISNAGPKPTKLPLATVEFLARRRGDGARGHAGHRDRLRPRPALDDYGGLFGVVATIVVAGAAGTILAGAFRRDPTLRTPRAYGDTSVRLAVSGLTLVLIGWALNLSISYWNMNAAASSLAVLTIAAVLVIVASRWTAALPEVPLAWVGAALGVLGLFLALGLWGELMELGTELELGVLDLVGVPPDRHRDRHPDRGRRPRRATVARVATQASPEASRRSPGGGTARGDRCA